MNDSYNRNKSIRHAVRGIKLFMESWFSGSSTPIKKNISFETHPRIKSILAEAQKDLVKNYKKLNGYKESERLCIYEYDDDLFIEFPNLYMDSYDNAVSIMEWNQDGVVGEYEKSLNNFISGYLDEIKRDYPDIHVYSDPSDTQLLIYFE